MNLVSLTEARMSGSHSSRSFFFYEKHAAVWTKGLLSLVNLCFKASNIYLMHLGMHARVSVCGCICVCKGFVSVCEGVWD